MKYSRCSGSRAYGENAPRDSEQLKLVDVVAELIDARIPVSSRNPVLKGIIGSKPKIVLMNKADMADPAQTAQWSSILSSTKRSRSRSTARRAEA